MYDKINVFFILFMKKRPELIKIGCIIIFERQFLLNNLLIKRYIKYKGIHA